MRAGFEPTTFAIFYKELSQKNNQIA